MKLFALIGKSKSKATVIVLRLILIITPSISSGIRCCPPDSIYSEYLTLVAIKLLCKSVNLIELLSQISGG